MRSKTGILQVNLVNIRDYTLDKHRRTDDYPFGGGAGMVMFPQPIMDAVAACDPEHRARRIYLSPRGRTLNQKSWRNWRGKSSSFSCAVITKA